jgi:glycosyltransferase involved in cell wall biosynthesis
MNILINASNLHAGGGVQVATSFIKELSKDSFKPYLYNILVSSSVHKNLQSKNFDESLFKSYEIFDSKGLVHSLLFSYKKLKGFDAVFSVFGAVYVFPRLKNHIVGFADPWIANPKNEVFYKYSNFVKLITTIKLSIKRFFFLNCDHLIVELPHVRDALMSDILLSNKNISVVENAISEIFFKPKEWKPINQNINLKADMTLGFLGRSYEHKNLKILIDVNKVLIRKYNLRCNFIFTLTESEMEKNNFNEIPNFFSSGSITLNQCPSFYELIDALIFPSLLECFSVTPLEAMIMKKQVIASDRKFIRDVCQEHALYFDPVNPSNIADVIYHYFLHISDNFVKIEKAYSHAIRFSSANERAQKYIEIINES